MKTKTIKGKQTYWPTKPLCPVCREHKVFEPHSFVVLSSWTLVANRRKKIAVQRDCLETTLELMYHGAHDSGIGTRRNIMAGSTIAESIRGGQVEFYFCSPRCVKRFLFNWVDELETKIKKEHNKQNQHTSRNPRRC